jgi:hypothetical protein
VGCFECSDEPSGSGATVLLSYCINTSYQTKLLPFVPTTVTQILEGLQGEDVFAKLQTSNLKMKIHGIGCVAHILHNALQTNATNWCRSHSE